MPLDKRDEDLMRGRNEFVGREGDIRQRSGRRREASSSRAALIIRRVRPVTRVD